jgi:hypothetical protein
MAARRSGAATARVAFRYFTASALSMISLPFGTFSAKVL